MLPEPVRVGTGYDDMLQRFLQDRLTWSDLIISTMPPRNPNNYNRTGHISPTITKE
jgi:hypothetical protein